MASANNLEWAEGYYATPSIKFQELVDTFCTQLSPNGLGELCSFCEGVGLFRHEDARGLTAQYLLNELKCFGIINEGNLQLLKHLAKVCDEDEMLRVLQEFEQKRSSSVDPLPPNSEGPAASSKI